MSAARPTVAVVIPVHRAQYLAAALDSVFEQSHRPDEIVLIDDGSPDQEEVAAALAAARGPVRVIRQANLGAGAARNAGIRATSADLVAFLDADDTWMPDFLFEQLATLDAQPDADVCYTDVMFVGRTPLAGRTFMSTCPSRGAVTLESLLAQTCNVPLSAAVVRRDALVRVGLFDVSLRRGQDFDLWLRLAEQGARFVYSTRVLGLRRIHDANLSGTSVTEVERPLAVLRKALETMTLTGAERAAAERRIHLLTRDLARERGKELLLSGKFESARRHLAEAGWSAGWKVRAALVGLHVAPWLVRRVYAARASASLAS